MSFPHYDLVERAYRELVAEGKIQHRDQQEAVEQDKGLLTRRAGYYAHERDATIGLLEKTSGNNSLGYSVDILISTDGTYWDIATDASGAAQPVNGGPSSDPGLIARWRLPTAALAGLSGSVPAPGPGPTPEPIPAPSDLAPVLARLDALAGELAALRGLVQQVLDKPVPSVAFPQYEGNVAIRYLGNANVSLHPVSD